MSGQYNVYGVGNALVDIIVNVKEDFLKENEIKKGIMTLVDTEKQGVLLEKLHAGNSILRSGGSAANTMIGIANCGGSGIYAGKVAHDPNGAFYKTDMEKSGILHQTEPGHGATGTCLVMVTGDGDRTMLTSLGISSDLAKSDINEDLLKLCDIIYVEGYLWDKPNTKEACLFAMETAKKHNKKVAFTYSDPFCVHRSRDEFVKLTKDYVDIAFCNHEEAMAVTQTDSPEDAIRELGIICDLAFMTWSYHGAYICNEGIEKLIPGYPVKVIDSNGAGDGFAAGTLYGLTNGFSVEKASRWGNYYASRVIQEIGPRLPYSLKGKYEEVLEGIH